MFQQFVAYTTVAQMPVGDVSGQDTRCNIEEIRNVGLLCYIKRHVYNYL